MKNDPDQPNDKPMSAWRAAASILTAVIGVGNGRKRDRQLVNVSPGTLLIAFLILGVVLYAGMRLFVHLVQAQLTP